MRMVRMRRLLLLLAVRSVVCKSYVIHPGTWKFKGHPIAYERAQVVVQDEATPIAAADDENTPVLLLNGFGVGSFHQHRLISALMKDKEEEEEEEFGNRKIYGIDYLGQGKSWPDDCNDGSSESEKGLRYCGRTWLEQVIGFIEDVILPESVSGKVHLVGNSVGGHLAVFIAAARPDLIETVSLLNATPVWGLNLPGWSGHLPAPLVPKWIGRYLFDRIRDLANIEIYLETAYANRAAFDQKLMRQIRAATEGRGGHAAFTSIMWSPPVTVQLKDGSEATFDKCLQSLHCDVLLLFGSNDPWCRPLVAKRMLKDLSSRPAETMIHRYVELSNVGHCPNHEAPTAVAKILTAWLEAKHGRDQEALAFPDCEVVREPWGETVIKERTEDDIPLSFMDRLAVQFV